MDSTTKHRDKSKDELINELSQIEKAYSSLEKSFNELHHKNSEVQKELTKRKKELQVIYKLSSLIGQDKWSPSEIFKKTVNFISLGWQYSEITCSRIIIGENEYKTANFKVSEWKQSETIFIDNKPEGTIELFYLGQKPDKFKEPFLKEEKKLLKVIAEKLGTIATQKLFGEKYTTIFKESPIAKCIIDLNHNFQFIDVNEVFLRLTHYSREELIGKRPKDIGLFKEEKIVNKIHNYINRQGFIKNLEYEYVTKEGEAKTTILNAKVKNVNGRNLAIASFIDPTEILLLKEAEKQANNLNHVLIESLPLGVEIINNSGKTLFTNEIMKKWFGTDMQGKFCWQSSRDVQKICSNCPLEKEIVIGKTSICETNGNLGERTFEISHTGFLFKGEKASLKLLNDITARKITEKKLRDTNAKLQGILDNLDDAYFQSDTLGIITYVNPAASRMLGYSSSEELVGMPSIDLYHHKEDQNRMIAELKRTGKVHDLALQVKRKDSSVFWGSMNSKFMYDEYGHITGIQGLIRDITRRKEIEKKLQESNTRLQGIMDNMDDAFFQSDLFGKIFYMNKVAPRVFGYASENELLGQSIEIIYVDVNDRARMFEELKVNGKTTDFICRGKRKDSVPMWISLNVKYIYDESGEIAGTQGLIRDITKRRETEILLQEAKEEIEKSEIRFKAISEQAMDGIALTDMEGRYVFVNRAFCRMMGYTQQELLKMTLYDLKAPNSRKNLLFDRLKQNKENGSSSRTKLLRKDNSSIYVDINGTILNIGNGKMVLGIHRDVSELVRHENELIEAKEKAEENETHLKESQVMAKLGSWELDMETGIFNFTDNFYKIFKTNAEEMGGYQMTVKEYTDRFVHSDDYHLIEKESQKAIETDDPNYATYIEHKIKYNDGSTGYIGVRIFIKKDNNGKTIKAYGVNQDITDRKVSEQELIKSKEKAEESDRLKSAFLMNVSHEIRTPMNGILGFINLLNEPTLDEQERRSFIDTVNKSGQRLLNTINDIVEISKIEIGDIHLVYEEVDVSELMRFHFNFFKLQADEKGIELKITRQVEGKSAIIRTDKQKLDGILMNLIRNAIKFTTIGTIEIGNYIENGKFFFYVTDTGRGIPEDKQIVIFDRFVQVELGNTRGYEGSGIGLSIVKAYLEALNGEIQVKSEIGKGSTFLFAIPFSTVMAVSKEDKTIKYEKSVPCTRTLLITEDDEVNFCFLERILSKEFKLLHAVSGENAIKLFNDNPEISLVLMDIKMPGKYNGLDTTRKIREINKQVPIIAQTAYAMESDRIEALDAGCNEYISKPYSPNRLKSLIKQYCS